MQLCRENVYELKPDSLLYQYLDRGFRAMVYLFFRRPFHINPFNLKKVGLGVFVFQLCSY